MLSKKMQILKRYWDIGILRYWVDLPVLKSAKTDKLSIINYQLSIALKFYLSRLMYYLAQTF
jgi:hypothetical protein